VTIHQRLIAEARAGAAVLVISQDLDELFAIADRIAVLAHGRLSPPRPVAALTAAGLGLGMAGRAPSAEAAHA
jgi:simple sugar transport system ATP-binding protein